MALSPMQLTASIPAPESVALFVDDMYLYTNVWESLQSGNAPLFERLRSPIYRNTWKGIMVSSGKNLLSITKHLGTGANLNASTTPDYRQVDIKGNLFEWFGDMSAEDATDLCNSYSKDAFTQFTQPLPTFFASPIAQAILSAHLLELRNSVSKIIWFAQDSAYATNTGATAAPFYRNLAGLSLEDQENLKGMLYQKNGVTVENGFWAQGYANVQSGDSAFLSTNTGIAGTNAVRQSIAPLWLGGAAQLMPRKFMGRNAPLATRAFYFINRGMFDAYLDYLVSLNSSEGGWQLYQEGNTTWLTYLGYRVYCDEDSDAYDEEVGAMLSATIDGRTKTFSRNMRALFTIPQNYWIGADVPTNMVIQGVSVGPVGFIIQPGSILGVDMGKVKWLAATCVGGAFKNPAACVFGYATSQTWAS
jgi:hypothetical protein